MSSEESKKSSFLITGLAALEIGLISYAIYALSQLVGNKDTSNDLSKAVLPSVFVIAAIIMCHTFLWYMYSTYNPLSMNLYYLFATSFSLLISLVSLSLSIVNRQ